MTLQQEEDEVAKEAAVVAADPYLQRALASVCSFRHVRMVCVCVCTCVCEREHV
jgi:hypothetical protein